MPRNSSGTYSLPLPDVEPGKTIEDTWANTTMADLANALTDSLSRTGQGGMQYPLTFGDGTVSAPGIAWTNETGSGLYRVAAADMRVTLQGYGDTMRWNNKVSYVWDATNSAWAAVAYAGGPGTVPVGVANLDTLVWNSTTSAWNRQAKNPGGVLPVGVANLDTLVWDGDSLAWVRQARNAGGSLPAGSATLTTLQWNNITLAWDAVTPGAVVSNINDGTVTGQTTVWNQGTAKWEANTLIAVSTANSAVSIGASMTYALGTALSVLNKAWVGNTAGTIGINVNNPDNTTMLLTAGTRASTTGTLPLSIKASSLSLLAESGAVNVQATNDFTFNSTSGTFLFQNAGITTLTFGSLGRLTLNSSLTGVRFKVQSSNVDTAVVQFRNSADADCFTILENGRIRLSNLPISSAGLLPGELWRNGNEVNIIP